LDQDEFPAARSWPRLAVDEADFSAAPALDAVHSPILAGVSIDGGKPPFLIPFRIANNVMA
jgi:hypothetical protein